MPDGNHKIESEDLGNMFAFYLTPVGINKTYVTVIEKNKITDVQKMNLIPFTKPARRIKENTELREISEQLRKIEQVLTKIPETQIIIEGE